jgi:hypothetical protein
MSEAEWLGLEDFPSVADIDAFHAAQNGSGPAHNDDSWQPQNLAELADVPPVEPTLGGLGFVYPGKRHVFSGPQESAKTLAAYVVGLEVVRRGDPVVLIDFEMGPWDAKGRLMDLGATMEELAQILYVQPDVPASSAAITYLVALAPGLVIIDAAAGAYSLQGLDDNKRIDVERFTEIYVAAFWRANIASIVLDHVVKNVEGRGNYAIGSERKVGGTDVHLGFSVISPIKRGATGLYKIVTHKDRGGHLKRGKLAEFKLASDPETHEIKWSFEAPVESDDEHPFRPTKIMEKVSRFLELQQEPVSRNTSKAGLGNHEYVGGDRCSPTRGTGRRKVLDEPVAEVVRAFREAMTTSPDFARLRPNPVNLIRLALPNGGGERGSGNGRSRRWKSV